MNFSLLNGKNQNIIINKNNSIVKNKNIRCHLILLENNKERYEYAMEILNKNNNISIFYAIDKNNKKNIDYFTKMYNIQIFNYGEIACALSHMLLIKSFINSKSKYQIVLEDDFKIIKRLPSNENEIENMLNDINIDYNNVDILYLTKRVQKNNKYEFINGCGTEGYILTKHGAEKIFNLLKNGLNYPIDIFLQRHYKHGIYLFKNNTYQINTIINAYCSKHVYIDLMNFKSSIK